MLNENGIRMVEQLAGIGCTVHEIATFLGVAPNTLDHSPRNKAIFEQAYARGETNYNISLRRVMRRKAIDRDSTDMQKFLAKNRLGMSDNPTPRPEGNPALSRFAEDMAKAVRQLDKVDPGALEGWEE